MWSSFLSKLCYENFCTLSTSHLFQPCGVHWGTLCALQNKVPTLRGLGMHQRTLRALPLPPRVPTLPTFTSSNLTPGSHPTHFYKLNFYKLNSTPRSPPYQHQQARPPPQGPHPTNFYKLNFYKLKSTPRYPALPTLTSSTVLQGPHPTKSESLSWK